VENGWQIVERLRRMARFGWVNLAADPLAAPAADLDLIVCRNVTIYFDEAAAQRLYRTLVGALAIGGWLMLGASDPLPVQRDGLERVEAHGAVLWRRVARQAAPRVVPTPIRLSRPVETGSPSMKLKPADGGADLEAGLLALEAGSSSSALQSLRRATFLDPDCAVAQFGLARAYLDMGDAPRAQAAFVYALRLLAPLESDGLVPGTDALPVGTLREMVKTHLQALGA
jgi:chemotaxis protein methyltransferase CheR